MTIKDLCSPNDLLAGFDILSRGAVKLTDVDVYSNYGGVACGVIVTAGSVTLDAIGSDYCYLYYGATNGLLIDAWWRGVAQEIGDFQLQCRVWLADCTLHSGFHFGRLLF